MSFGQSQVTKILCLLAGIVFLLSILSTSVLAQSLNQDDQNSIYNDTEWYKANSSLETSGSTNPCGPNQVGSGPIDQLMQAIAEHESGGDPTAYNSGGGAYGRYQMIHSTWQSRAKAYDNVAGTNIAGTYPNASDDKTGNIQDAVEYIFLVKESVQFNGSVFKIAVDQYYPIANTNFSLLDTIPDPGAGNTVTVRDYANLVVSSFQNKDGSDIKLGYQKAPKFNEAAAKTGKPTQLWAVRVPKPEKPTDNPPSGTQSGSGPSAAVGCTCSQAIITTAMSYAWPTFHQPVYLHKKQAYEAAVTKALANGEYVGPTNEPYLGVDCGAFVTRVMRDSGADKKYNSGNGNTVIQQQYLDQHPDLYQKLGSQASTANLQPGDIAINSDHTYIYTGKQGFPGYNSMSASFSSTGESWRAPMADNAYFSNEAGPFIWYRIKCPQG